MGSQRVRHDRSNLAHINKTQTMIFLEENLEEKSLLDIGLGMISWKSHSRFKLFGCIDEGLFFKPFLFLFERLRG